LTSALIKYDAAVLALAECKRVDEVKTWSDKAAAMQAYGRMAKNKDLEVDAAEIRLRAERRLGELIAAQKAGLGLNRGTRLGGSSKEPPDDRPKLSDAGIDKKLSSRAQKLAAVPRDEFESEVGQWRERVSAEGARVSAKLQASGARRLAEKSQEDDGAPSDEELYYHEQQAKTDHARLERLLSTDQPLAASVAECKQLQAKCDQLSWRINGLVNENAELIKSVKYWQSRCERAEKRAVA